MKVSLKLIRHYRYHLVGLMLSFPMVLPATETRNVSMLNSGAASIVNTINTVRCTDGFLSVKVHDVTLAELLSEIARLCGFTLVPYVALEQRLSAEFYNLTLAQGLRRILGSRSFALKYAPPLPEKWLLAAAPAETLWILPRDNEKHSTQASVPATTGGGKFLHDDSIDVSKLESTLSDGNSEDREQAAAALGKRGDASAVAPLIRALSDSNAEVRETVIASLAEIGGSHAVQALAVALRDDDPRVREQIIDALGEVGGQVANGLLQHALTDDVAFVRQAAAEVLEQLKSGVP